MARFLLYPHLSLFDKAELAYLLAPFLFAVYEVFSTEKSGPDFFWSSALQHTPHAPSGRARYLAGVASQASMGQR